jgi:hypothetical protein
MRKIGLILKCSIEMFNIGWLKVFVPDSMMNFQKGCYLAIASSLISLHDNVY